MGDWIASCLIMLPLMWLVWFVIAAILPLLRVIFWPVAAIAFFAVIGVLS